VIPSQLLLIVQAQPHPLLFATVSGAHLYGFPSPDSDYDLRGVHILPLTAIAGLREPKETIESDRVVDGLEIDLVTHDVGKFMHLLLRRNGYVLEQLLSPLIVHTTPAHDELRALAPACITRYHAHHYLGFARTQWDMFQKETPPRVKPLLYVYRVLLTGIHLMRTGQVEANLVTLNEHFRLPYLPDLIARKLSGAEQGTLTDADRAFHAGEYARLVADLESARDASALPNNPTAHDALHDLLLRVRGVTAMP
jgi:uncharacterized protein